MMRIRSQTIKHDVNVLNYVIFVHAALYYCIIAIEILRELSFKHIFVWICLYCGIRAYFFPPPPEWCRWRYLSDNFNGLKIKNFVLVNTVCLMVFNATFNNISVISWWSVLLLEETGGNRGNDKVDRIMLYTSSWSDSNSQYQWW
jgi:hypothetical protein